MTEEEGTSHDKTVTIRMTKTRLWQIITAILAILLVISILTGGFGLGNDNDSDSDAAPAGDSTPPSIQQPTQPQQPAPEPTVDVSEDDDAVKGDANAPVTIIEFSDYECPYCGRYYTNTYPSIVSDYVDTGKVKIVFRDFPLSFHPNAQKAAEAAECAGEQDTYLEMHDMLFENQDSLGVSALKGYAEDLGLDTEVFNSCLDNGDMRSEVQKDLRDGSAAGVSGTPSFFINGKKIVGAQPYSVFKAEIEAALAA